MANHRLEIDAPRSRATQPNVMHAIQLHNIEPDRSLVTQTEV